MSYNVDRNENVRVKYVLIDFSGVGFIGNLLNWIGMVFKKIV